MLSIPAFAQQGPQHVGGVVSDEIGNPLPGVVVMVQDGTNKNFTVSDDNGRYSLNVAKGSKLVFSCLGYLDKEVTVGDNGTVNVSMSLETQSLDEIVVVGYGTQKKKDLTGGVAVVNRQTIDMVSTNNLMDRLTGQVAGLNITHGSEAPGSDQTILIRGQNSLTASNDPLIILDGIPYSGSLADIDPNNIESLSVLKDASAVAIYGSRGSNGVILIQTRQGAKGDLHVTYKTSLSIAEPMQRIQVMGPNEYIRFKQDLGRLSKNYSGEQLDPLVGMIISASEKVNYAKGITNDWQDYVFRTVFDQYHQLSFNGGTDNTQYLASVSYLDNPGVVYNSNYKRVNVYLSLTQTLNSWLQVGLTTQFVNRDTGGVTPNLEHAIKQSPWGIYKDETGNYYEEPMDYSNFPNPMKDVNADQKRTARNFIANGFVDVKLPVNGLSVRSQFGYNYRSSMNGTYYGRNTVTGKKVNGRAELSNSHTTDWTWENTVKYVRDFNEHHIDLTGLFSMQETKNVSQSQSGESFVNDDSSFYMMSGAENSITISSGYWKQTMVSGMFRANYNYNSRYMLTLTGRADAFSAFAENNKWAFFPSAAIAWNMSEENFIKDNVNWIDMLKIRFSYGANGNNAISRYQSLDRLYATNGVKYIWGDSGDAANAAYLPTDGIGNKDLKWETTYTANLGVDFQFFKGRLSGTIDTYLSNTHDLLMKRTIPIMNGYKTVLYNVGQTRNKGVELTLHSKNIQKGEFGWDTDFTFTLNRDEIVELRGDGKDDINNKWFIGEPLSVYYDWKMIGIWQEGDEYTFTDENGNTVAHQTGASPGAAKLKDANGDGIIDSNDKVIIGSTKPSFTMSMGNRLNYKDFYMSFLINGVFGKWMSDNVANISSYTFGSGNYIHGVKYWTPEHPDADVVSPGYSASFSHGYYKKLSYVQFRNVTLGYRVNHNLVRKVGLSGVDVNLSVNNLGVISNMRQMLNYDNTWFASYPTARSYMLGITITF
jgi:TonB-linked SusC/RagA family outer membrane protein